MYIYIHIYIYIYLLYVSVPKNLLGDHEVHSWTCNFDNLRGLRKYCQAHQNHTMLFIYPMRTPIVIWCYRISHHVLMFDPRVPTTNPTVPHLSSWHSSRRRNWRRGWKRGRSCLRGQRGRGAGKAQLLRWCAAATSGALSDVGLWNHECYSYKISYKYHNPSWNWSYVHQLSRKG